MKAPWSASLSGITKYCEEMVFEMVTGNERGYIVQWEPSPKYASDFFFTLFDVMKPSV